MVRDQKKHKPIGSWLLLALGVAIPLTDVSRFYLGGAGSLADAVIVLLAAATLLVAAREGIPFTTGTALVGCLALLILLSWAAWLGRAGPDQSAITQSLIRWVEYLAAFACVHTLTRRGERRRQLFVGLGVGCGLAFLIAVVHWRLGPGAQRFWQWGPPWGSWYQVTGNFRVWGSFGNPLELTTYLGTFIGTAAVLAARGAGRLRRTGLVGLFGLPPMLVVTGSRSSLIVAVVAFAVYLLIPTGARGARRRSIPGIRLAVVALVVAGVVATGAGQTVRDRLTGEAGDASLGNRGYVMTAALAMMRDHPLLGVGTGRFAAVYGDAYWVTGASSEETDFSPENRFLMIGAEVGIPAMLVFSLLFLRAITGGFGGTSLSMERQAIAAALLCYAVMASVQPATSAATNVLLFALLGAQEAMLQRRHAAMLPKVFHVPGLPPVVQTQPTVPPAEGAVL